MREPRLSCAAESAARRSSPGLPPARPSAFRPMPMRVSIGTSSQRIGSRKPSMIRSIIAGGSGSARPGSRKAKLRRLTW